MSQRCDHLVYLFEDSDREGMRFGSGPTVSKSFRQRHAAAGTAFANIRSAPSPIATCE